MNPGLSHCAQSDWFDLVKKGNSLRLSVFLGFCSIGFGLISHYLAILFNTFTPFFQVKLSEAKQP